MYQIIILPHFYKQIKSYIKKYRGLKNEVINSLETFNKDTVDSLGGGVYKVRLKSKDLPKGKSKSFRIIILLIEVEQFIVPITIYFKGDKEFITKKEINNHLEKISFQLEVEELIK